MKGVEGPTRGVLEEEGWLVTDLLGFDGPLCGLLQQCGPLHKKKREREGGLKGRCWRIGPCSREHGQDASSPVQAAQTRCSLSRSSCPFNKLSYCKSVIKQGKHGHPTSPTTHTSKILCPHRLFSVSYSSIPGEGAMSQLLNLPIIFQPTQEDGCFPSSLPPTRTLTIENVIHASRL